MAADGTQLQPKPEMTDNFTCVGLKKKKKPTVLKWEIFGNSKHFHLLWCTEIIS